MRNILANLLLFFIVALNAVGAKDDIEINELLYNDNNTVKRDYILFKEKCFSEFKGTSMLQVILLLTTDFPDQKAKCWLSCMMKHYKFMDTTGPDTGKINEMMLKQRAKELSDRAPSKFEQTISNCAKSARDMSDICEKATDFIKCVLESLKTKRPNDAPRQGEQ